jgi:hypothetical protein
LPEHQAQSVHVVCGILGDTEGGASVINAQIAPGYALTLRLRHQWYLVTSTSGYETFRRIV